MRKKYGLRHGDKVKLITRRGEMISYLDTRGRNKCPQGLIYTTFFDAGQLANKLTLDATDPISGETDFKKCAVKSGESIGFPLFVSSLSLFKLKRGI